MTWCTDNGYFERHEYKVVISNRPHLLGIGDIVRLVKDNDDHIPRFTVIKGKLVGLDTYIDLRKSELVPYKGDTNMSKCDHIITTKTVRIIKGGTYATSNHCANIHVVGDARADVVNIHIQHQIMDANDLDEVIELFKELANVLRNQ